MQTDRYGLPLATASGAAAAAYRDGVDLMLAGWPGAEACFDRALAADEGFALAHAAYARQHQIFARGADARASIAKARAAATGAREKSHVDILGKVIEGKPADALAALLVHIGEWPRDAVVLALALGAFGLYAFSGRADHDAARLALCEKLARHYGDDWWFLMHLGWSHTEAGSLEAGRRHTTRSFELRRENAHCVHAMGHWYAEAGQLREGEAFIAAWLPAYAREGVLHGHLWWHCSLAYDDAGRTRTMDLHVRPAVNAGPPINRISDGASLLWRLSLAGPLPRRAWDELAKYVEDTFSRPAHHFMEWHIAMVLAARRDEAALETRIADVRAREASGALPTGGTLEAVYRGLAAFGRGDYRGAVGALAPVEKDFVRLGGSTAQRRLLKDTLQAANK